MSDRVVAAFDFDGTLTRTDTVVPFLASVSGWARTGRGLARLVPRVLRGVEREVLKEQLIGDLLGGMSAPAVDAAGERFADRLLGSRWRMRLPMIERLHSHHARGHDVVLVSASLEPYLRPVGAHLGLAAVLATRLEVRADGRLTGRIAGRNCRGPEKVARLREWLGDRSAEVWAYGDSRGDDELLAWADHAVRKGTPVEPS